MNIVLIASVLVVPIVIGFGTLLGAAAVRDRP